MRRVVVVLTALLMAASVAQAADTPDTEPGEGAGERAPRGQFAL